MLNIMVYATLINHSYLPLSFAANANIQSIEPDFTFFPLFTMKTEEDFALVEKLNISLIQSFNF